MKKRNCLEQKWLNDLIFVQYNLRLICNQLLNKRPDIDPIVLEDVDPTSDWVVEAQSLEFDIDYDLEVAMELADDAAEDQMDADPLVGKGPRGLIPESGIACPRATTSRAKRTPLRIPRVPLMMIMSSSSSPSQRQMLMPRARMLMPFLLLAVVMIDCCVDCSLES
jgi:hypothetical protein